MEDNCEHAECIYGKPIAQTQPAKAFSQGGLLAKHQSKTEHAKFIGQLNAQRQQPRK
jgi:hypothetical protein